MAGRAVTARARVAVQKRDVRIQAMATQRKAAAKSKPAGAVGRTLWLPNTVRLRLRLRLRLRVAPAACGTAVGACACAAAAGCKRSGPG